MRKLIAVLLTLCLLSGACALADHGEADITYFDDISAHLTIQEIKFSEAGSQLTVTVSGFAKIFEYSGGFPSATAAVMYAVTDGEEIVNNALYVPEEGTAKFIFNDVTKMPDELQLLPTRGSGRVTMWQAGDPVPGAAVIPEELAGTWSGTGTPKGGGPAIDLTATINADGTGEYTFVQSGYTESYPISVASADNSFTVDVPADNYLSISKVEGTYTLEDGTLLLDITTTFTTGSTYSYTAACTKEE